MHQDDEDDAPEDFPFLASTSREIMARALRYAALRDGAPARCRRKDCRRKARCHVSIGADGESLCPGGVSQKAIEEAALMLVFLIGLANPGTMKF